MTEIEREIVKKKKGLRGLKHEISTVTKELRCEERHGNTLMAELIRDELAELNSTAKDLIAEIEALTKINGGDLEDLRVAVAS